MAGGGQWKGERHAVAGETRQSAEFRQGIDGEVGRSDLPGWSLESVGCRASDGARSTGGGGNLIELKICVSKWPLVGRKLQLNYLYCQY